MPAPVATCATTRPHFSLERAHNRLERAVEATFHKVHRVRQEAYASGKGSPVAPPPAPAEATQNLPAPPPPGKP